MCFDFYKETAILPMGADYDRLRVTTNHTGSDNFKSGSNENNFSTDGAGGEENGLVLNVEGVEKLEQN